MATDATSFPQAIALSGTFDPGLMRRVQSLIAGEMRARGVFYTLSPVVDIVRDPRWGRIEETFGEDPYLVSEMSVAAVEGLQGAGKFEKLGPGKIFATLKHMLSSRSRRRRADGRAGRATVLAPGASHRSARRCKQGWTVCGSSGCECARDRAD